MPGIHETQLLRHNPLPNPNFAVIIPNMILTTACTITLYIILWDIIVALNYNHWMIKLYLSVWNEVDWDCILGVFSALHCYQKALTWIKLCLCLYIYTIFLQGVVDKRKGVKCFVQAQMVMSWYEYIQTKHDALTNFFNNNYGAK